MLTADIQLAQLIGNPDLNLTSGFLNPMKSSKIPPFNHPNPMSSTQAHHESGITAAGPEQQAIDRRNFIKTSGIAALSAAALTPDEVAAQAPSMNTATLETAIKEAIASATSAAPSPHDAVAGSDGAAGVGSGPLDLSPAKWLHAGVY